MKVTAQHPLIDALLAAENLRNDADLAKALEIAPDVLSRTRHGKPVSERMRLAIQRKFRWSLKRIDELAPPAQKEKAHD